MNSGCQTEMPHRFPACFFDPGYEYPLPPEHPFPMEKFRLAAEILSDIVPGFRWTRPDPVSEADVARVHTPDYLEKLKFATMPQIEQKRTGLPVRPGLFERSCLEVAGTLAAAEAALRDGMACNLAGGTHHAYPSAGSGYCVLNDVAITIAHLRQDHPEWRFLVVDTDAHQGNGTHAIFAHDPKVFTYSIHVGRNFPSKKEPGTLDVPLPRWVEGDAYLDALQSTLPAALESFRPDFVFWVAGADPHREDRFGQMQLRSAEMDERNRKVLEWIDDLHCPLAVLFGGGYHRLPGDTAKLHVRAVLMAAWVYSERSGSGIDPAQCLQALDHRRVAVVE